MDEDNVSRRVTRSMVKKGTIALRKPADIKGKSGKMTTEINVDGLVADLADKVKEKTDRCTDLENIVDELQEKILVYEDQVQRINKQLTEVTLKEDHKSALVSALQAQLCRVQEEMTGLREERDSTQEAIRILKGHAFNLSERLALALSDVQVTMSSATHMMDRSKFKWGSSEELDAAFEELLARRLAGELTNEEFKRLRMEQLDLQT